MARGEVVESVEALGQLSNPANEGVPPDTKVRVRHEGHDDQEAEQESFTPAPASLAVTAEQRAGAQ